MVWIQFVALVVVVVVFGARTDGRAYHNAVWRDCTRHDSPVTVTNLNISPNPVIMPGNMYFTIQGFSNRTLGSSRLLLDITRKVGWFNMPIPCMFNIGSCTYDDMCTLVDTMIAENWAGITTQFGTDIKDMLIANNMNPGLCPQPPRVMSINRNPIRLPTMPSILSWFAEGQYNANVRVIDNTSNEELVCFDVTVDVRQPQQVQEPSSECSGYFSCIFGRK